MRRYFHASTSLLDKIDQVQTNFIRKIGVSDREAFLEHNFMPCILRRNIAILGLLHKRVIGKCHASFEQLLPWYSHKFDVPRGIGHNKQLYGHWLEATQHPALFSRSIFSMVDFYNNLPQYVVDSESVSRFQTFLTSIARKRCRKDAPFWQLSFCRCQGPDLAGPQII